MATATKTRRMTKPVELPDTYQGLVAELVPGVIHDAVDHKRAMEMLSRLMDAGDVKKLNADQAKYGELLAHLVADYQRSKRSSPKISGLAILREMMNQHNLKGVDIARVMDVSPTLASRILNGERTLTWEHAQSLGRYFHLRPDMFMVE